MSGPLVFSHEHQLPSHDFRSISRTLRRIVACMRAVATFQFETDVDCEVFAAVEL